ncbi:MULTISPECIES: transglycosylase domain-containing protein [Carnobacterium]|uniref:Penicillin-binding protein n=1 Tax=Carnobacterium inhibens TaxID=147709 RepID=A0ABR7TBF6_9LACT|nr:transglycosylase domain-containing protein [Carnobacterium inhibens]MBC9825271.1 penicillin-binding protein [Carnobacterium inhibens]
MNSPQNNNEPTFFKKLKVSLKKVLPFIKNKWISFKTIILKQSVILKESLSRKDQSQINSTSDSQSDNDQKRTQSKNVQKPALDKVLFGFNVGYSVIKNLILTIVVIGLIGAALAGGLGIGYFAYLVSGEEIPTYEEMKADIENVSTTSAMYYATGEKISDLKTDLKRSEIPLSEMSPLVQEAIIATEDEYFYKHSGVVPKAVARALVQEVTGASTTSGGSTLTQQLVKQQILTNEVSFKRKANEILLAFRVENYFTKEEILENYLNVSPFGRNNKGQNIAGLNEASIGIFGVKANELTLPQAAFLAGLPQNPIVYSPYTQTGTLKEDLAAGMSRKDEVLFRMYRENYITKEEYDTAVAYDLTQDFLPQETDVKDSTDYVYNFVEQQARQIIMEQLYTADGYSAEDLSNDQELSDMYYNQADQDLRMNGYTVYSTIDKGVYEAMNDVVEQYANPEISYDENNNPIINNTSYLGNVKVADYIDEETNETKTLVEPVQNGAVLRDNATGRIISFIGGVDYELTQVNHAYQSPRSPGSTIKPLLAFAPALEEGIITPATMLFESSAKVPSWENGSLGVHEITNAGNVIPNKWTDVRTGLTQSSNIVTSKIYQQMKDTYNMEEKLESYMHKMGFGSDIITTEEYQGVYYALPIGGITKGTTVLDQTDGFSTLANKGNYTEGYIIEKIEDHNGEVIYQHEVKPVEVFTPETAYLTTDILRDVLDSGTAKDVKGQLNFTADIAGKTGTSDGQKDIWFIGYTPQVTLSSWIGYDNAVTTSVNDLSNSGSESPSLRNKRHWARLMNAIYNANPTILGTDQAFQQPDGIVEAKVLAATGMQPGKVKLANGKEVTASGATKTELFNKKFLPKTTTYNFGFSASDKELADYWEKTSKTASDEAAKKAKAETDKKKDETKKAEEAKDKAAKDKAEKDKKAQEEAQKKADEAKKKAEADKKAE